MNKLSLTPLEAQERLRNGAQLVDVRLPGEFVGRRVAGSINVPLNAISTRMNELAGADTVLICRSGHRSGLALDQLRRLGINNAVQVEGGLRAWTEAGLPVEDSPLAVWELERQVRFFAGLLVVGFCGAGLLLSPVFFFGALAIGSALTLTALLGICPMMSALQLLPWNRPRVK